MPGPNPVGPVRGFSIAQPEATPEEVHGGPANPYHEYIGEQAEPYPWEAFNGSWGDPTGPQGPENELLGDEPESMTFAAGVISQDPTGDLTPPTHAAPTVKGVETSTHPDASARRLIQSMDAHAVKTNASAAFQYSPTMHAQQDEWTRFYNVVPGEDMVEDSGKQVSFQSVGWGVKDHTSNSYARRNQYGFDSSHRMRRYAVGSVPGNYMWMRPGSRPMVKTVAGPARPAVGVGPFAGQETTQPFDINGAILQEPPTQYSPPPQPYVAPTLTATPGDQAPTVDLW